MWYYLNVVIKFLGMRDFIAIFCFGDEKAAVEKMKLEKQNRDKPDNGAQALNKLEEIYLYLWKKNVLVSVAGAGFLTALFLDAVTAVRVYSCAPMEWGTEITDVLSALDEMILGIPVKDLHKLIEILIFYCAGMQPWDWLIMNSGRMETMSDISFTIWAFSTALITFFLGCVRDKRYGIQIIDIILSGRNAYGKLVVTAAAFFGDLLLLIFGDVYELPAAIALGLMMQIFWMLYFFLMICCETSLGVIQRRVLEKCRDQLKQSGEIDSLMYRIMRNTAYEDDSEMRTLAGIIEDVGKQDNGYDSETDGWQDEKKLRDFVAECTGYILKRLNNRSLGFQAIGEWLRKTEEDYVRKGIIQGVTDHQYYPYCPDIENICTIIFSNRVRTVIWGILYNELKADKMSQKYRYILRKDLWNSLRESREVPDLLEILEIWERLLREEGEEEKTESMQKGLENTEQEKDLKINLLWETLAYGRYN